MTNIFFKTGFLAGSLLLAFTSLAQDLKPGLIKGRLVEPVTKGPVSFAAVGLFTGKDSSQVSAATADETGKFQLQNLPTGNYYLQISLVGYTSKKLSNLQITNNQPALDLGTILVSSSAKKISEVEIVAQKELVEYGLDKQTINVAKDISTTGGTASDALKNAPSVAVDIDGNVSVRGSSNVTVLIDGKNTGQSAQTILSQTPASAIEKIEVITNPSAKYDAEGMGGIINIVLKKERKAGLNGNLALNLGTYDNHNASLSLNYNYKKFNFFAGYDYMQQYRRGNYALDRESYFINETTNLPETTLLFQRQNGVRTSVMHMPKLGFDFNLSDKQTITLSAKMHNNQWREKEAVSNNLQNVNWPAEKWNTRLGLTENGISVIDYSASYRKTFVKKRQEFNFSAVLTDISGSFDRYYDQYLTKASGERITNELKENFLQEFHVKPFFTQADYVHPIGENGKIEAGAKHSQRVLATSFVGQTYDFAQNQFVYNPLVSNKFNYAEYINAGYLNYANSWKKLSYQVGFRAEQTEITVTDKGNDSVYHNPYLNFFPSIFLSQEINEQVKIQLNYSRRVNRPNYEALNPFINYSDPYNIWHGEPKLMPEFIDSYEGSYLKFWNSGSVTATGFYRQVHNVMQQVRVVDTLNPEVAHNYWVNLNNGTSYGVELSGSQALAKWFKVSGNVSGFNYKVSGAPLGVEANSSRFSWLSRVNANVTLPKSFSAQVSVNYRSPQALAQGTRAAIYNTDFSVKKDVLNKKASITLRVSDVFNTLRWDTYVSSDDFKYDLHTKRQTRQAILGFSYRFGEQEKRRRPEAGNSLDGMF